MTETSRTLRILGTRGVPGAHGGFETFAEYLSLYLVQRGWRVVVYCQKEGSGPMYEDTWQGVERVCIPIEQPGGHGKCIVCGESAEQKVYFSRAY